jgi:3-oxoacyl-[acyl-carrier protein] reductase
VVINMSSGIAITPLPSSAVYGGTKAAVDVITRVLALELGPRNIRVVGIAPGLTSTEGLSENGGDR